VDCMGVPAEILIFNMRMPCCPIAMGTSAALQRAACNSLFQFQPQPKGVLVLQRRRRAPNSPHWQPNNKLNKIYQLQSRHSLALGILGFLALLFLLLLCPAIKQQGTRRASFIQQASAS
jgi:hypothetical protein